MMEDYKLIDGHYHDAYGNWIPKKIIEGDNNGQFF